MPPQSLGCENRAGLPTEKHTTLRVGATCSPWIFLFPLEGLKAQERYSFVDQKSGNNVSKLVLCLKSFMGKIEVYARLCFLFFP